MKGLVLVASFLSAEEAVAYCLMRRVASFNQRPPANLSWVLHKPPSTWSDDRVCSILERLFLERAFTPEELILYRKARSSPYPPKPGAFIHSVPVGRMAYYCGHNPILVARKVQNLTALDEYELAWEEVTVEHRAEFCRLNFGVEDCRDAAKGPTVIKKRWIGRNG